MQLVSKIIARIKDFVIGLSVGQKMVLVTLFSSLILGGAIFWVGYQNLVKVSDLVIGLIDHRVPAVQRISEIQRLITNVITDEKEYLISGDEQYINGAQENIQKIFSNLDFLSDLANQYQDDPLAEKVTSVHSALDEYGALLVDSAAKTKENRDLLAALNKQEEDAVQQIYSLLNTYVTNTDLNASQGYASTLQILETRHQLQLIEKEYLLSLDSKDFERLKNLFDELSHQYNLLVYHATSQNEKDQIEQSRQAQQNYLISLEAYEKNQIVVSNDLQQMDALGKTIQNNILLLEDATWQEVGNSGKIITLTSQSARTMMGIVLLVAMGMSIALILLLSRSIIRPLRTLVEASQLISAGELLRDWDQGRLESLYKRGDEIGEVGQAFYRLLHYIQNLGQVAQEIAAGNLSNLFAPLSERDELGNAFGVMTLQLREVVSQLIHTTKKIGDSAQNVHHLANQADSATSQVTMTIQQMAQGIGDQSQKINESVVAIDHSDIAIQKMLTGFEEQEKAVDDFKLQAQLISESVKDFLANIDMVRNKSSEASDYAQDGSLKVQQSLKRMGNIRAEVDHLNERMKAVGTSSDEIGMILESIEEIASQTNMLAINATIEAAHAESQSHAFTEELLDRQMVSQNQLIASLLELGAADQPQEFWTKLGMLSGIDQLTVTDEDGTIVISKDVAELGWCYPEDPSSQAYAFRAILKQKDGVVCQPAMKRSEDDQVFKYVGISRRDTPGIISVGYDATSLSNISMQIGGFKVVASEVYSLAEKARQETKNIRGLVKRINTTVSEAAAATSSTGAEVLQGVESANIAAEALQGILSGIAQVHQGVDQAKKAARDLEDRTAQLNHVVQKIDRVISENVKSNRVISDDAIYMSQALENIASVSQENSAAAEEISATSSDVHQQMSELVGASQSLEQMTRDLQALIDKFRLS